MEKKENSTILIQAQEAGQRIDKFLFELKEFNSRSQSANLIQSGKVLVNKKKVKPSYLLREGDRIEFSLPIKKLNALSKKPMDLNIVFEDDDLLVVNKPSGLVVHPATSHQDDTLVNGLLAHTQSLSTVGSSERPGIVHRIDKDTSGLLVIAKNDEAHRHLAQQFKEKSVHRIYWAIVFGEPKEENGKISSNLARHPIHRKKFASCTPPLGKQAITHFKKIQTSSRGLSLLHLSLETGRTHQIRVHLSEKRHPIVGDELYGGVKPAKGLKSTPLRSLIQKMDRFALHAAELGFIHPRFNRPLSFSVGWPENLMELVEFCDFE